MIYTKTNSHHLCFHPDFFKPLSEAQLENNSVYWYDQHDLSINRVHLENFVDEIHWNHIRSDSTAKIFLFFADEYYNLIDLEQWITTLKDKKINAHQVYLMCMDENWKKWTNARLKEFDYEGIKIQSYNFLMNRVELQEEKPIVKRFSMLSRNYLRWRLFLYASLIEKDLLDRYFNYTFNNIFPYGNIITFPQEKIIEDLNSFNFSVDKKIRKWIKGIPYTPDDEIRAKVSDSVYDLIKTASINIVVESHYDPHWHFPEYVHIQPWDLSPAFPTEKTYKAIACRKPFIMFSTPWFLKEFRELGYKTFHPYIDESYDNIVDNTQRLFAIVNEVERLCNLSESKFDYIIKRCREITEYNFQIMGERKKEMVLSSDFAWLQPYLKPDPYWMDKIENPQG